MAATDEELERAARLIERLLVDAEFRAAFRRDPVGACRASGLDSLADDIDAGGKGMQTLELRESKSSLAGVVMAVAAEGIAVAELQGLLGGHGLGLHGPARAAEMKAMRAAHIKVPHVPHGSAARLAEHQIKAAGASGHTPGAAGAPGSAAGGQAGGGSGASAAGGGAAGGAGGGAAAEGSSPGAGGAAAGGAAGSGAAAGGAAGGGAAAGGAASAAAPGGAGGAGAAASGAGAAGASGGGAMGGGGATGGAAGGGAVASAASAGAHGGSGGGSGGGASPVQNAGGAPSGQGGGNPYAPPSATAASAGSGPTPTSGAAAGVASGAANAGGAPVATGAAGTPVAGTGGAATAVPGAGGAATAVPTAGGAATAVPGAGGAASVVPAGGGTPAAASGVAGAASAAPAAGGSVGGVAGAAVEGAASVGAPGVSAASVAELLQNPRLAMPADARALFTSGTVDPRLLGVLTTTLQHHTIVIGDMENITDPVHAQAIDITAVDGQPIDPSNVAARDLITEIAALDPSTRPNEIGTPWPIQSQGFFTDPTHQNRLHLAFTSQADYTPTAATTPPTAPAGAGAGTLPGPAPSDPAAAGVAQAAQQAMATPPTPAPAPPLTPAVAASAPAGVPQAPLVPEPAGAQQPGVAGQAAEVAQSAAPAGGGAPASGGGAAAALAYAHSMIGKLPESAGNNLGPALDQFEAQYGFHGAPWCGIFVGHALQAAGLNVPHSVASVAAILQMAQTGDGPFQKGILPVSAIRPGDLVTFGGTEHVALVTSVQSDGIHTIAGNTGQSNVSETTYSPDSVTGVVRPNYGPAPDHARIMAALGSSSPAPAGAAPAAVPAAAPAPAAAAQAAAVPGAAGQAAAAPGGAAAASSAGAPAGSGASQPQTNSPMFEAVHHKPSAAQRHTVQFMASVDPNSASPASGQTPGTPAAGAAPPAGAAGAVPAAGGVPAAAGVPGAAVPGAAVPGTAGATPADQLVAQAGELAPTGAITVSSPILTSGQEQFVARLSQLTGLDPKVAGAWVLAEESGSAATARQAANNYNWLNIGYFDSGAGKIAFDQAFSNPVSAAEQTARFLEGKWGGASSSIRAILNTVHQDPQSQMQAIADSDWASSHYGGGANLRGTFDELANMEIKQA